jgi:hypothetical protein
MAISHNVGTTITGIVAVAAFSARATYRIHMNDLGRPRAVPVNKQEYDPFASADPCRRSNGEVVTVAVSGPLASV